MAGSNNEVVGRTVQEIARDYHDQAKKLRKRANVFLASIVIIVLVGVGLAVTLPALISRIEPAILGIYLPQEAQNIKESLEGHNKELKDIVESAKNIIDDTASALSEPYAVWQWDHLIDTEGKRIPGTLQGIHKTPDGGLIAVGWENIELGASSVLLLRGNAIGKDWDAIPPTDAEGKRIRGRLFDVHVVPDGGLIAVGLEGGRRRDDPVLLLRGYASGKDWDAIRPIDGEGKRIRGGLFDVQVAPEGGLIAVGWENIGLGVIRVLLLRGDASGEDWHAIRPTDAEGKRIPGRLREIHKTPDGGLIAVGSEGDRRRDAPVLLLRGDASGEDWHDVRPTDAEGKSVRGTLFDVQVAPEGELIAVGSEEGDRGSRVLLLRADASGEDWHAIRPTDAEGKRIPGTLLDVYVAPQGGVHAIGAHRELSFVGALLAPQEIPKFPSAAESIDDMSATWEALKAIKKELSRSDLWLPQDARAQRDRAQDLLTRGESVEKTRDRTEQSYTALKAALTEADVVRRLSRTVTRIAVIALLIYLVQIMVNLYRYRTRLAAFYQARGDALDMILASSAELNETVMIPIDRLIEALSPSAIDYGRPPPSPLQQIFGVSRESVRAPGGASRQS